MNGYDIAIQPYAASDFEYKKAENLLKKGTNFGEMLQAEMRSHQREMAPDQQQTLKEAAKQMEVQLTTLMLKTMEETSSEEGLLGRKSQGLGYFRDIFFESVAERMVEDGGLGFAQSLENTYGVKDLAS